MNPLTTCLFLISSTSVVFASVSLSEFFPYDDEASRIGPLCDDCTSPRIPLSASFEFFGVPHNKIIISTNGYVTFGTEMSEYRLVCSPKEDTPPMIAPFWADLTSRHPPIELLTFSERLDDQVLFEKASREIRIANPDFNDIEISWIFIVTWLVRSMSAVFDKFQLVLATDYTNYFAIFYYNTTLGTTSMYQGDHARVGYDAADGNANHTFYLPDSCKESIKNVMGLSNYGHPGKFVFRLDDIPSFGSGSCDDWNPGIPLAFKPGSLVVQGHRNIKVKGPCLTNDTEVDCVFVEEVDDEVITTALRGTVLDKDTAQCPTPFFAQRGKTELQLKLNGSVEPVISSRASPGRPAAGSLQISGKAADLLHAQSGGAKFDSLELTWDPNIFPKGTAARLVLCKHSWNPKVRTWDHPKVIPFNSTFDVFPNTGRVSVPKALLVDSKVRGAVPMTVSIQQGNKCYGSPGVPSDMAITADLEEMTLALLDQREHELNPSIEYAKCQRVRYMVSTTNTIPCPPTLKLMHQDMRFKPYYSKYFPMVDPGSGCYVQVEPIERHHESSLCCYDEAGEIQCDNMRYPEHHKVISAPLEFHPGKYPWRHFIKDVLPWYLCCYVRDGFEAVDCQWLALNKMIDCGDYYEPPTGGGTPGDPHFLTVDNFRYTFNGHGEYVLVGDASCTVQIRTESYRPPSNEIIIVQNVTEEEVTGSVGTVVSGLAFHCKDSDILELLLDPPRTKIQPLINKKIFKFPPGSADTTTGPIYLGLEQEGGSDYYLVSLMGGSFAFKLKVESGTINHAFVSTCRETGTMTYGLAGNCDGEPDNDLKPQGAEEALPADSSLSDIHYKFGETWRVTKNSSLFSYAYGLHRKYESVNRPRYQPMLQYPDKDSFSPEIQAICGDMRECYFDYRATGSLKFANSTVSAVEKVTEMRKVLAEGLVNRTNNLGSCANIPKVENGRWVKQDNDTMRLVCSNGFTTVGADTVINCVNGTVESTEIQACCRKDCSPREGLLRQMYCFIRNASMKILFGKCF